jgi:hypothetical protein
MLPLIDCDCASAVPLKPMVSVAMAAMETNVDLRKAIWNLLENETCMMRMVMSSSRLAANSS